MQRLSTSATLLLKFFLPTFWFAFFGLLTLTVFFAKSDFYGRTSATTVQLICTIIFILGGALLWWSVMRLKRMEADEEYLYVTNYFKTFRYSFESIQKMNTKDFKFFKTLSVELKEPGSFGQKMNCVISEKLFTDFMHDNPKIAFQFGFPPK